MLIYKKIKILIIINSLIDQVVVGIINLIYWVIYLIFLIRLEEL